MSLDDYPFDGQFDDLAVDNDDHGIVGDDYDDRGGGFDGAFDNGEYGGGNDYDDDDDDDDDDGLLAFAEGGGERGASRQQRYRSRSRRLGSCWRSSTRWIWMPWTTRRWTSGSPRGTLRDAYGPPPAHQQHNQRHNQQQLQTATTPSGNLNDDSLDDVVATLTAA